MNWTWLPMKEVSGARFRSRSKPPPCAIIEQPRWVTEGAFLWWTEPLLEAADLIVWLDLPFRITGWRIVKRHVQLNLAGTNRHPDTGKLVRFLYRVWERQSRQTPLIPSAPDDDGATTRMAEAEVLAAHADKVIRCSGPADVARLKAQLFAKERNEEMEK